MFLEYFLSEKYSKLQVPLLCILGSEIETCYYMLRLVLEDDIHMYLFIHIEQTVVMLKEHDLRRNFQDN